MPETPVEQGDGWFFNFPITPTEHVHYVQNFDPPSLIGPNKVATFVFRVDGGGFVPQEFPYRTALVSALIQRSGDNWSARGEYASYRWFSKETVKLADGTFTLSVPLDVQKWGDVYGGKDPSLFQKTLKDAESIGLVFGSDGGRGHGVYATDPSTFTLISFEVTEAAAV